jgi:hypothetical protein
MPFYCLLICGEEGGRDQELLPRIDSNKAGPVWTHSWSASEDIKIYAFGHGAFSKW